jgi:hypothetical protein
MSGHSGINKMATTAKGGPGAIGMTENITAITVRVRKTARRMAMFAR